MYSQIELIKIAIKRKLYFLSGLILIGVNKQKEN